MTDTSGRLFEMPWACWDPASSSWRTYAGTSHSGSMPFSGTWPTSGSMRDGACYEHPTWEHPTSAPASSLLPTPSTSEHTGPSQLQAGGDDLRTVISLLPTPAARDHKDAGGQATNDHLANKPHRSKLPGVLAQLLPTPRAQNGEPRNQTPWERPLDEPQNLENAVARIPGVPTKQRFDGGKPSTDPHQPPLPTGDCPPTSSAG